MTGLDTENDKIIEIAVIVTDKNLNVIKESKSIAIKQDKVVLDKMDEWNKKTHKKTGLIERVLASKHNEKDAENYILNFLSDICYVNSSPMCGNSICQDRRFYLNRCQIWRNFSTIEILMYPRLKKFLKGGLQKN